MEFFAKQLICKTLAFRFGKRAVHNEVLHNLHNVRVNILAQFVQYIYFVLYVKTIFNFVPIIESKKLTLTVMC